MARWRRRSPSSGKAERSVAPEKGLSELVFRIGSARKKRSSIKM